MWPFSHLWKLWLLQTDISSGIMSTVVQSLRRNYCIHGSEQNFLLPPSLLYKAFEEKNDCHLWIDLNLCIPHHTAVCPYEWILGDLLPATPHPGVEAFPPSFSIHLPSPSLPNIKKDVLERQNIWLWTVTSQQANSCRTVFITVMVNLRVTSD